MEAADYLRDCTQERAGEIRFTLSVQEALTMPEDDLRQEFLQMAPLMSRLYASFDHGGNGVEVVITPVYRAGVRMLDAWRTDDESALSQQERSALDEAEAIVERLQARYSSSLELERAIFDELCAGWHSMRCLKRSRARTPLGVSAAFALTPWLGQLPGLFRRFLPAGGHGGI